MQVSVKRGRFEIFARVQKVGDDMLVILGGGTKPHIGAIGMAHPRPSLRNNRKISASSSVFTFLGHKEDILAKSMSEELAAVLNTKTVVVAGMHWKSLKDSEIVEIEELCRKLTGKIIMKASSG